MTETLTLFDVPLVKPRPERVTCPGCGHRFAPSAVWVSQGRPACFGCAPRDTIAEARAERDAALTRVSGAAGEQWAAEAWSWLRGYLESHVEFFPDTACREGPEPPEKRAWGAVVLRAKREGWIRATGEFRARTRGHATPGAVYRSMLCREGAA